MSDSTALAAFVKQAKTLTSETALISLIRQVLSAPDVFVFGELLALDNVKQVYFMATILCADASCAC